MCLLFVTSYDHRRMRRGGRGGSCPPPKFGQTVGEIRANSGGNSGKARRKNRPEKATNYPLWNVDDDVTQAMSKGGVLVNPFGMLMMTSHRQCPRGGACECPRVGVFFKFWEGG